MPKIKPLKFKTKKTQEQNNKEQYINAMKSNYKNNIPVVPPLIDFRERDMKISCGFMGETDNISSCMDVLICPYCGENTACIYTPYTITCSDLRTIEYYSWGDDKDIHDIVIPCVGICGSLWEMVIFRCDNEYHVFLHTILEDCNKKTHKEKYHEYLKSPQWKELREKKLKEAGNRCQLCNSKDSLHIHHRTYDRVFNESLDDLICLCKSCHEKFHDIDEAA